MSLAHDPMGHDPHGTKEIQRQRKRLAEQIDHAVENHLTDELLGNLVRHAYSLRYFDGSTNRLVDMIDQMVDRYTRKLIIDWIKDHEDELWEGVEARLKEHHLANLGAAIVDEFMDDYAKGRK